MVQLYWALKYGTYPALRLSWPAERVRLVLWVVSLLLAAYYLIK